MLLKFKPFQKKKKNKTVGILYTKRRHFPWECHNPFTKRYFVLYKNLNLFITGTLMFPFGFSLQNRVSDSPAFQHQKANFYRHCFSFSSS